VKYQRPSWLNCIQNVLRFVNQKPENLLAMICEQRLFSHGLSRRPASQPLPANTNQQEAGQNGDL
jgi:hypothetical protein